MKVRTKKTLRTEQITLYVLLVTGLLAFILSILLEFLVSQLFFSIYNTFHLNYVVNLLLGISCSAAISFIGQVFPYLYRKNGQVDIILSELRKIYHEYVMVYISIWNIKATDDFSYEKYLYKNADELTKDIYTVITKYENSDFTSDVIEEINKMLRENIIKNLLAVKEFCSCLLWFETSSEGNSEDTILYPTILKDKITKRAEEDCYKFLLEKIDELFSLNSFQKVYNPILDSNDASDYANSQIKEILDNCNEINNVQVEFAIGAQIRNGIIKIRNKHSDSYDAEVKIIRERLKDVIKQIKNNDKEAKFNHSSLDEILKAIENDDLQKADQILNKIEKKIKIKK